VLVLGDSTAVGVGADSSEDTVAGRVSSYLDASSVENYSVSGALTREVPAQAANAKFSQYRLILIQTGGNDIIRFRSAKEGAEDLRAALGTLPAADRVVIISAGDVGGATLFPFFIRPSHTKLNNEYHAAFAEVAEDTGVTYVNFGNAPATTMINDRPDLYLSPDGLHPSSEGYALWFDTIKPSL
jgi:lysophospholipase L1-like esterase